MKHSPLRYCPCSVIVWLAALAVLLVGAGHCSAAGSVTFQAEAGSLGSDWAVSNSAAPAYITIRTDGAGYSPSNATRVASYTVTFPEAGLYQLYARLRVGSGGYNDDSMFYASSFGAKNPALNSDWVFVNGLAGVGFSNSTDVVTGSGSIGGGIWKWVNLSQLANQAGSTVTSGSLTQTFQIGGRENGLDLDKFVFGTSGISFTVSNLDNGTMPAELQLTNTFAGPDGIALHRFNPLSNGLNLDGANPACSLSLVGDVLCGTTLNGGVNGAGTLFSVSLDGANYSAFRSFTNAPDAGNPAGHLGVTDGSLFGVALGGGTNGAGAIFVGNTNGSASLLRSFAAVSADDATNAGGASPGRRMALSGGRLYGTASAGGTAGNGTVFALSTNGSGFVVLHDFGLLDSNTGTNSDGAQPCGGLVVSGATLYGTASAGGSGGGVVFCLETNGGNFRILHSFTPLDAVTATNIDGAFPVGGLLVSNATLYGTTFAGGSGGKGVLFSLGTNGQGFTVLHHFSAMAPETTTNLDGASPCGTLALSGGRLYGTASVGGAWGSGAVFSVGANGEGFHVLHAFSGVESSAGTNRDGAFPVSGVIVPGNVLYGTAFGGGPGGAGTVFGMAIRYPPAVITDIVHHSSGAVTLHFLGVASSTNVVQSTGTFMHPVGWQNVATNVADGNGIWQFTETNTTTSRFYRSYAP